MATSTILRTTPLTRPPNCSGITTTASNQPDYLNHTTKNHQPPHCLLLTPHSNHTIELPAPPPNLRHTTPPITSQRCNSLHPPKETPCGVRPNSTGSTKDDTRTDALAQPTRSHAKPPMKSHQARPATAPQTASTAPDRRTPPPSSSFRSPSSDGQAQTPRPTVQIPVTAIKNSIQRPRATKSLLRCPPKPIRSAVIHAEQTETRER